MITNPVESIGKWLQIKKEQCAVRWESLNLDHREDEANFEKIKSNVYDICQTVLEVSSKLCQQEPVATKNTFLQKIAVIFAQWERAREEAQCHEDLRKVCIETIKLDTGREALEALEDLWEVLQ